MQTFGNSNIITSYIKGILHEFNLPSCEALVKDKYVYKDNFYIYKNYLLRSLSSGLFDGEDLSNFKIIKDTYTYGNYIPNFTRNMKLDSLVYDSYTHNWLGRYLRFYKDYKGINLMSLYNCFAQETVNNIDIVDDKHSLVSDNNHTIYMVSVQPYNEYTIYYDCNTQIEMIIGYYSNGRLIDINNLESLSEGNVTFPYDSTYMAKNNTSFNKPFIYDKIAARNLNTDKWNETNKEALYSERENLKLFIKVPQNNESALVVLEGNYLDNTAFHFDNNDLNLSKEIIGKPYIPSNGDSEPSLYYDQGYERTYLSKLQLVNANSGINHPFSDRLIEYLFENVIKPDDAIENNISRLQKLLQKRDIKEHKLRSVKMGGYWDNSLRNLLYAIAEDNNLVNTSYDILGYCDKDIEHLIKLEDDE